MIENIKIRKKKKKKFADITLHMPHVHDQPFGQEQVIVTVVVQTGPFFFRVHRVIFYALFMMPDVVRKFMR